ncbi:hypothetical protein CROQUDRAFT_618205 [Cronartium quercuum f. sp. fusiforme G11]|uniref:Uncharacterized protein n=1 Tax=Cronartium quercuum f. sp. fusiforme G11 TaxID=708437 RepID=A0A9P6T9U4_9BASI|nr:hypothetical protein CROQUDRAFT_618205 [Cronartium quercuum f. sp. fusiforme G11]
MVDLRLPQTPAMLIIIEVIEDKEMTFGTARLRCTLTANGKLTPGTYATPSLAHASSSTILAHGKSSGRTSTLFLSGSSTAKFLTDLLHILALLSRVPHLQTILQLFLLLLSLLFLGFLCKRFLRSV